jgi:WXG100 family type VII secretion target
MSTDITVDAATLSQAAKDVRSVKGDVAADLTKIRGYAQGEIAAGWKGDAGLAFQKLMQEWDTNSRDLLAALEGIADLLDKAGSHHLANDQNNQQALGKIMSALNVK